MPRKKLPLRQLEAEAQKGVRKLRLAALTSEAMTSASLLDCRRQIVAIVSDLLPVAAALARRGRPRLLAVCQKVLQEQSRPKPVVTDQTLRIRR